MFLVFIFAVWFIFFEGLRKPDKGTQVLTGVKELASSTTTNWCVWILLSVSFKKWGCSHLLFVRIEPKQMLKTTQPFTEYRAESMSFVLFLALWLCRFTIKLAKNEFFDGYALCLNALRRRCLLFTFIVVLLSSGWRWRLTSSTSTANMGLLKRPRSTPMG